MPRNKPYLQFYIGWILLVTAAALIAWKMNLFAPAGGASRWWALFLLVPAGGFAIRAFRRWHEGERKRSRNLIRVALFILPVTAGLLYPTLWRYIYIPFIAMIAIDMMIGGIIAPRRER